MPRLPYPKSTLDPGQIVQFSFDEESGRLRTDSTFDGTLTINLDATTDSVAIGDPDTGDALQVNADGSINANVSINQSTDSIRIGDGTDLLAINPDGSINANVDLSHTNDSIRLGNGVDFITSTTIGLLRTLDIAVKEMPATVASEATLVAIQNLITALNGIQTAANTLLTSIESKVLTDAQLRASPISISASSLPLPTGAATAANQDTTNTSLASIDSKLTSPLAVIGSLTLADEPIKMSGTENGAPGGTEFTFVNTLRNQILAAKDREQDITYADFGTKDERITQIDYTATSIGTGIGYTARKTLIYTLVSGKYRRDSINWSLV